MIRSYRDKETEKIVNREPSLKFKAIQPVAERKLNLLNAATELKDLSLPSLRLKKLEGDRKGQYSIRINDQFRICFTWRGTDAFDVEIVDYH